MEKGFTRKSQGETNTSAAAQQKKAAVAEASINDRRPEAAVQRKLQEAIQGDAASPSQLKTDPTQRAMEDDEEMPKQGKFILQREGLEDEKEL